MEMQTNVSSAKQVMKTGMKGISEDMQMCIANCTNCHQVCEQTLQHCLEKGGKHAEASHIRTLLDCAQICLVSADFMTRNSKSHMSTCRVCAGICNQCAADCEKMNDDEMMQMCIEACRRCAESCAKMAGIQ